MAQPSLLPAAPLTTAHAPERRPILWREALDPSPRRLRKTLKQLVQLLESADSRVRRRALLMFGELISGWQRQFSGEPISAVIEVLPDAIRMTFGNAERTITPDEWDELVSAMVIDLVDDWGIDRRVAGCAWFEFRLER